MIGNILEIITASSNSSKVKIQGLEEVRTLLEKVELGIEAYSKEDTTWGYTSQLGEVKVALRNIELELHHYENLKHGESN